MKAKIKLSDLTDEAVRIKYFDNKKWATENFKKGFIKPYRSCLHKAHELKTEAVRRGIWDTMLDWYYEKCQSEKIRIWRGE